MKYRALDSNGDMILGKGSYMKQGIEAVKQAVITRLKLLKGEWWENTDEGLPLFQEILGKRNSYEALIFIKQRVLNTKGVLSVDSFNVSFENRRLTVTGKISTEYGSINIEEILS